LAKDPAGGAGPVQIKRWLAMVDTRRWLGLVGCVPIDPRLGEAALLFAVAWPDSYLALWPGSFDLLFVTVLEAAVEELVSLPPEALVPALLPVLL